MAIGASGQLAGTECRQELAAVRIRARQEVRSQSIWSGRAILAEDAAQIVRHRIDDAAVGPGRDGEVDEDVVDEPASGQTKAHVGEPAGEVELLPERRSEYPHQH